MSGKVVLEKIDENRDVGYTYNCHSGLLEEHVIRKDRSVCALCLGATSTGVIPALVLPQFSSFCSDSSTLVGNGWVKLVLCYQIY